MTKELENLVKNVVGIEDLGNVMTISEQDECIQEMEDDVEKDADKLSVPFICVLGMLQRVTVKVPDKSQSRLLVLGSIIKVLNTLQEVKTKEDEDDDLRLQVRRQNLSFLFRLIVVYISFIIILEFTHLNFIFFVPRLSAIFLLLFH